jgi:hypothetical protein
MGGEKDKQREIRKKGKAIPQDPEVGVPPFQ